MLISEGFHQIHLVFLGGGEHFLRLRLRRRERLFAQHVLAALQRPYRPFIVQGIRQRNVHRLHLRIIQQLRIASIRLLKAVFFFELLRLFRISARNRVHFTVVRQQHSRNGASLADKSRAQYAPFDLPHDVILLLFAGQFAFAAL